MRTKSCLMKYLCSECSTQLSKWEIELNELYPVGRLYCEFCQNKHERQLIEKLKKSFENDLDIYDYPKYIAKLKKQEQKKQSKSKFTRKKFPKSWVFNILKRESTIPPNDEIIRHNICNIELQPNICDV